MPIRVTKIQRENDNKNVPKVDPDDRQKLFVNVDFAYDDAKSSQLKKDGFQTTPRWNGWYILNNFDTFTTFLKGEGMTDAELEKLKEDILNT